MENDVFLTGGSGVIGSALVPEILKNTSSKVYLLLRATSEIHLRERFAKLIKFWNEDPYSIPISEIQNRVVPVCGDVTNENFGLTSNDLAIVEKDITHIIHCAASVKLNMTSDEAAQHCLLPTKLVLQFLKRLELAGRKIKLEFVSTVGISGKTTPLVEAFLNMPREFHNTYEWAKAQSEIELEKAIQGGHLITVHRPSMVIGHSRTGKIIHFQVFYYLADFLTGKYTLGIVPRLSQYRLDLIPNDYVAQVICWSLYSRLTIGKILHLCAGGEDSLTFPSLKVILRDVWRFRKPLRFLEIPDSIFLAAVKLLSAFSSPRLRRTLNTLPHFLNYLGEKQIFENSKTLELLKGPGISYPKSEDFTRASLEYYIKTKK